MKLADTIIIVVSMLAGIAIGLSCADQKPCIQTDIKCNTNEFDQSYDVTKAALTCGQPYTKNILIENNHTIEQWVYDAGTFIWFRDGHLTSYKVDPVHKMGYVIRKPVALPE